MSERIIDYHFDLLDDAERAAFEALLLENPRFSAEVRIISRTSAWLVEIVEPAVPPPDLVERTVRRLIMDWGSE